MGSIFMKQKKFTALVTRRPIEFTIPPRLTYVSNVDAAFDEPYLDIHFHS